MTKYSRSGRLDVDLVLMVLSWSKVNETSKTINVAIKQIFVIEFWHKINIFIAFVEIYFINKLFFLHPRVQFLDIATP